MLVQQLVQGLPEIRLELEFQGDGPGLWLVGPQLDRIFFGAQQRTPRSGGLPIGEIVVVRHGMCVAQLKTFGLQHAEKALWPCQTGDGINGPARQ